MPYAAPIFSSGNPTVDSLFGREFGTYQADQAARMEAAKNEILRQQVMAQARLAEAQQQSANQQQQYNNLFRLAEFKDRQAGGDEQRKLFSRQLDIDEKARVPRTDLEAERRKSAIIDANAAAINDAQRANALYKINFAKALADAKAQRTGFLGTGLGSTAGIFDDPKSSDYKAVQNQAFNSVRSQLLAEKGGALNSLIPDADTFTFNPVQYDTTGKAIALPLPTTAPAGTQPSPVASPVPFVMNAPAVAASTKSVPEFGMPQRLGMWMGGVSPPSAGQVPAAPALIHVPVPGGTLEISQQDADELERQIRLVPDEQRAATFRAMQDQLLKSSRARIIAAPAAVPPYVPAPTFMPVPYQ